MPLCVLIDDPAAFSGFACAIASMLELPVSSDVVSTITSILTAASGRYAFDFDTSLISELEARAVRGLLAPPPAEIQRPA